MKHLGIYPGTFDPIHDGHISFAYNAMQICNLDGVIFLPENQPRHKTNVTATALRAAQIRGAIHDHPSMSVEILNESQFTTNSTLPKIQKHTKDAKLTLLVGSDVALSIADWSDLATLLAACDIAIGMRINQTHEQINTVISTLQKRSKSCSITIIQTEYSHLASSALRNAKSKDL